jgi:hypothetical protein
MAEEVEEASFLSAPTALWEPDVVTLLVTLEVWTTSSVMAVWQVVRCSKQ